TSADECMAIGILIPDGTGLRFRHELVRMAVEAGIAPHRKTGLHARLLAALEERGDADPALLAHHAEGAGDAQAVLRHAPDAAKRSAALGAHREAAAQYERALRCAENLDKSALAALYEGLASEYALLDRWEQAEGARRAALALRRELGDQENVGANLRLLSITLWGLCRGKESNRTAEEAVATLEALPPGKELGWAYANLANSGMALGTSHEDMQRLLGKAGDIGEQFGYLDVVCYALNGAGLCLVDAGQDGMPEIEESLQLALATDLPESAGRAYSSLDEAAPVPGSRPLLRRGPRLLRGKRTGRLQHVHQRLASPRAALSGAVGRSRGDLHPEAGQPRHLAGQPAQPPLRAGHHPGAPRRG